MRADFELGDEGTRDLDLAPLKFAYNAVVTSDDQTRVLIGAFPLFVAEIERQCVELEAARTELAAYRDVVEAYRALVVEIADIQLSGGGEHDRGVRLSNSMIRSARTLLASYAESENRRVG